jgi:hypothetical protein
MLTYLDLGSDILVIKQYLEAGELTGATVSLCFLASNLTLQVGLCAAQNFRNPKVMWREIFYTLILLKPALDVIRLIRGERQEQYQTFSLLQENSYSKGIEVATEALPAALCQLYFLLLTIDPTALQLVSILVSIITTAVTVASMDFASALDPIIRSTEQGMAVRYLCFVPDGIIAEFRLFIVMICCSFTQMTTAALGTALMANYDQRFAMGAWAGRVASMYAIKMVRRDLAYFLPVRGPAGIFVTLVLSRPTVLLVTDFSFFVWGRHPLEMGCMQWWSGRVWAWLLLVVSIVLHSQQPLIHNSAPLLPNSRLSNQSTGPLFQNATSLSEPLSATAPWVELLPSFAATLFGGWLLSHLAFFFLCKRECWPSFFRRDTAAAYAQLRWNVLSDEKRAGFLVKMHPSVLYLVATHAHAWIEMNWDAWQEDPPEWLTDRWLRGVPSAMLPKKVLTALGGKRRRRSTLKEQLEMIDATAEPRQNLGSPSHHAHVVDMVELPSDQAVSPDSESVGVDAVSSAPEFLAVVPT